VVAAVSGTVCCRMQGYHSPDRKKSKTFPDDIADNILNKCTFINIESAGYELRGAF